MNKVTVMVCCDDPEGGHVLEQNYAKNTQLERGHFFDCVVADVKKNIQELESELFDEWYINGEKEKLCIILGLKEEFVESGHARNGNSFIGIYAVEKEVIDL